jgi:4-amino-4-deoxy-L-arabinose transferase-like glycosyltransferase
VTESCKLPTPDAHTPRARGRIVSWLFAAFALLIATHIPSFLRPHLEGDEEVYQVLAREMNWDFSHYTTMDDARIREFPSQAYRLPLYFHPPLFPYVLKIGGVLGKPVVVGLLFQIAAMLLLIYSLWRAAVKQGLRDASLAALLLLTLTCPVLNFSTSLLHLDGLMAAFLTSGLLLYYEATQSRSMKLTAVAALLLALALNTKFNSLIALPLVGVVQLAHLWRTRAEHGIRGYAGLMRWEHWRLFVLLVALLVPLGGWHYFRMLGTYGTLFPFSLRPSERTLNFSIYTRMVHQRTRSQMFLHLLLLVPAATALLSPWIWKGLRADSRGRVFVTLCLACFALLFLVTFAQDNLFRQERYYCIFLPFMYLSLVLLVDRLEDVARERYLSWIVLSSGLMLCTVFLNVVLGYKSSFIAPALVDFLPFLDFLAG